MKKIVYLFALLFISLSIFSQDLRKPSEGKSMVYFVRSNSKMGVLINFKYFDGEKFLGKFHCGKFLAYECEPGKHVFYAKSPENLDFIEANLEAGKIYIIDSKPKVSVFVSVKLVPFVDNVLHFKNEKKYLRTKKRILNSIIKKEELITNDKNLEETETAKANIETYNNYNKANNSGITQLTAEMNYKN